MVVTEKEYKEMWKEIDGMIFTPIAKFIEEETEVDGVKEKIFTYEILKTTDEVYKGYLNPLVPYPTEIELIKQQLLETQTALVEIQYDALLNTK